MNHTLRYHTGSLYHIARHARLYDFSIRLHPVDIPLSAPSWKQRKQRSNKHRPTHTHNVLMHCFVHFLSSTHPILLLWHPAPALHPMQQETTLHCGGLCRWYLAWAAARPSPGCRLQLPHAMHEQSEFHTARTASHPPRRWSPWEFGASQVFGGKDASLVSLAQMQPIDTVVILYYCTIGIITSCFSWVRVAEGKLIWIRESVIQIHLAQERWIDDLPCVSEERTCHEERTLPRFPLMLNTLNQDLRMHKSNTMFSEGFIFEGRGCTTLKHFRNNGSYPTFERQNARWSASHFHGQTKNTLGISMNLKRSRQAKCTVLSIKLKHKK